MRVLVTRPASDASDLAARLGAIGVTAVIDPLLDVELLPVAAEPFGGAAAVVATSRNALRALAASPALQSAIELPMFAVGGRTEQVARDVGFVQVTRGPGTARALAEVIVSALSDRSRSIVYLAGEHLAFDLTPVLRSHGYDVVQITAYRTVAAKSLMPDTRAAIADGQIDAVLLLSPRTASVYSNLVVAAGLEQAASRLIHVCLSASVAGALTPLSPERVIVSERPNIEDLLALVAAQRHTPPRAG